MVVESNNSPFRGLGGDTIFVTGIGTGIGKTLVSAILAEALECDYWKPVQAGRSWNNRLRLGETKYNK